MKKTIKKTIELVIKLTNKVLRLARFHKPENFFRSSYITNEDSYYINIPDRLGLSNNDSQREWALYGRVTQ